MLLGDRLAYREGILAYGVMADGFTIQIQRTHKPSRQKQSGELDELYGMHGMGNTRFRDRDGI